VTRASRRGFALPILLLALFGAAVVWAVYATRLVGSFDQRAKIQTETALRIARDALIQYAAQSNTPGALPCPDTTNNGIAGDKNGVCSAGAVGRLPWRTLGIDPPRDGSGECIWYAVSGDARSGNGLPIQNRGPGGKLPALNPGWSGSITLHDHASGIDSNVIAVLFAPGPRLQTQTRVPGDRCNDSSSPGDFLEALDGYNDASGTQAVRATATAGFNDVALAITAQDLYTAVIPRVLVELGGTSSAYGFRQLLLIQPAAYWGGTSPVLDFTSPVVQAAFPQPPVTTPPTYATIVSGCTHYTTDGTTSAAGVYSIEWLCFNQWLPYVTFHPNNDFEVVLSVPAFGWQVIATPNDKTRLQRIPQG
jgi:hypothetical protein